MLPTTWQHQNYTTAALGYSRSGLDSPEELYDQKTGSELEINYPLYKELLGFFRRIAHASREANQGKDRVHLVTLKKRPTMNPSLPHGGFRFEIKVCDRVKFGGEKRLKLLYNVVYSLVPQVRNPSTRGRLRESKLRWFLNVGCNPSAVSTNTGLIQVNGFWHRRLGKEAADSVKAFGLFHTIGYWMLEDLGSIMAVPELKFTWPDDFAQRLLNHEPVLNEVSFSFYGQPIDVASAHALFAQMHMSYRDHHVYAAETRERQVQFANIGRLLNLQYEHQEKPYQRAGSDVVYDVGKITLSKTYASDRHPKVKLQMESFATPAADGSRPRRMRYTISFLTRFWQSRLAMAVSREPFTLARFIEMCDERSPIQNVSIFRKQHAFAAELFNESTYDDFMLPQLLGLRPAHMVNTLVDWAGDDELRNRLITSWLFQTNPDHTEKEGQLAKRLGIDRKTLYRYKADLMSRGVDLGIPLPAYTLLLDAMLRSQRTVAGLWDSFRSKNKKARDLSELFRMAYDGDKKSQTLLAKMEVDTGGQMMLQALAPVVVNQPRPRIEIIVPEWKKRAVENERRLDELHTRAERGDEEAMTDYLVEGGDGLNSRGAQHEKAKSKSRTASVSARR